MRKAQINMKSIRHVLFLGITFIRATISHNLSHWLLILWCIREGDSLDQLASEMIQINKCS